MDKPCFIFDIETTGLPMFSAFRCMSYSWSLEGEINTVFTLEEAVNILRAAMCVDVYIAGHNIFTFDLPLLLWHHQRSGSTAPLQSELIRVGTAGRLLDTLIFSVKLFPLRERHGMGSWASMVETVYGMEGKTEVEDFATASDAELAERCSHDVRIQQCLTHYFCETHGAPDNINGWEEDCAFFPVVLDLLTSGLPYDRDKAAEARKLVEARLAGPLALWETTAPGVNPNSTKQIDAWLVERHGKGLPRTKKGRPSFNKQNKRRIVNEFPELGPLLRITAERGTAQFLDKDSKSNCENYIRESVHTGTEAVFPSMNVYGTRTHRASYSNPPLNQFPKHIRGIVEAPRGWLMVGVDIVALEMSVIGRAFREVLDDDTIERQVRSGVSVKQLTMDAFAPAMERTVYQPGETPESLAKKVNYALIYGAGIPLLMDFYNADRSVIEECVERRFPGFKRLSDAVQRGVRGAEVSDDDGGNSTGTMESFYGTQIRTEKWKALNTLCQTSGAEYAKRVFTRLHERITYAFADARAIIFNHDELQWLVRGTDAAYVEGIVKEICGGLEEYMDGLDDGVGFLTGVDYAVGSSWKETH